MGKTNEYYQQKMLRLNPREFNSFMTETSIPKEIRKKSQDKWEKSESLECLRRSNKVITVENNPLDRDFLCYSDLEAFVIDEPAALKSEDKSNLRASI